ncbi:MAG: ATP-binding protein [Bacillota bacterium]|jgi:MinD superfamily P-loop ATPase|nr:ATP-binding protein [Bacillota bacterium]NLD12525.1 P-loop NTPase [Bacillota bacterium]
MIISVASGKGGTGKTTVAVNLALTLAETESVCFLDCDVEEPNAHLFLKPELKGSSKVTVPVPVVDEKKCNRCGLCGEVCAFNAILPLGEDVLTFHELCHGCGGCTLFCPTNAIREEPQEIGVIEWGNSGEIFHVQGKLNIGSPLAPPIVKAVRAHNVDRPQCTVYIIDAPPGTSCPVVSSVMNADFCLLVTEPTPFGLHDLKLAVDMVRELKVPFGVVINRAGLGYEDLADYCKAENIPVLAEIPFDRRYAKCYAKGGRLIDEFPEIKKTFRELRQAILVSAGRV